MSEIQMQKAEKQALLTLSDEALQHLSKQLAKEPEAIGFRLSLSKTGCSGLSYVMDYTYEAIAEDRKVSQEAVTIYIENKSFPYLKGLAIDFRKEGLNHKLVYNNPNQTGACGCGESFTVE